LDPNGLTIEREAFVQSYAPKITKMVNFEPGLDLKTELLFSL